MENISFNLLVTVAIVSLTVIIVACIICYFKVKRIKFAQSHEKTMKELEFSQKQQWEKLMTQKISEIQNNAFAKEFDTYKKKVDDLETHSQNTTSLDMNKIAVLHLILSGNRGESDAESLEKEIKKVRESYKVIENYLKN